MHTNSLDQTDLFDEPETGQNDHEAAPESSNKPAPVATNRKSSTPACWPTPWPPKTHLMTRV